MTAPAGRGAAIALVVLGAAGGALLTGGGDGAGAGVRSRSRRWATAPPARTPAAGQRHHAPDSVSGLPRVGGGGFYQVWMLRDPAHLVALGELPCSAPTGRARASGHGERPSRAEHLARAGRRRPGALRHSVLRSPPIISGSAPTSIPPVLRALLTAHVRLRHARLSFRVAAHAEVTTDVMGSAGPACRGPRTGPRWRSAPRSTRLGRSSPTSTTMASCASRAWAAGTLRSSSRISVATRRGAILGVVGANRSICSRRTTIAGRSRGWTRCISTSAPRTATRRGRSCASATWR